MIGSAGRKRCRQHPSLPATAGSRVAVSSACFDLRNARRGPRGDIAGGVSQTPPPCAPIPGRAPGSVRILPGPRSGLILSLVVAECLRASCGEGSPEQLPRCCPAPSPEQDDGSSFDERSHPPTPVYVPAFLFIIYFYRLTISIIHSSRSWRRSPGMRPGNGSGSVRLPAAVPG